MELCRELLSEAVPFPGASCCWAVRDLQLKKRDSMLLRTTNILLGSQGNQRFWVDRGINTHEQRVRLTLLGMDNK